MKNYKRRLSIILTLVLIITSLGFTGVFAGSGEVAEVTGDELQAIEQNDSNAGNLENPVRRDHELSISG